MPEMTFKEALAAVAGCGDPLKLQELLWPHVMFYDRQVEIIYSVRDSVETFVTAGNQLGKDYVTGFIALSFFMAPQLYFDKEYVAEVDRQKPKHLFPAHHRHTRRIVTTSSNEKHLNVLWSELAGFAINARVLDTTGQMRQVPLIDREGGFLNLGSMELRLSVERTETATNCKNYVRGMVAAKGESISGHHADYTLLIGDEASGLEDSIHSYAQGWAKRFLYIGNPNPSGNFYEKAVEDGDVVAVA